MSQINQVLKVLERDGHITHLVAQHYKIGCIRKVISTLRKRGYNINTETAVDGSGHEYTRWKLIPEPKVGDKVVVVSNKSRIHYFPEGTRAEIGNIETDGMFELYNLNPEARPKRQWVHPEDCKLING